MPSLSLLDQLALDAFAAALDTCREEGIELPEEIGALATDLESHAGELSAIAQQHPQLNLLYRNARNVLRRGSGDRQKRIYPTSKEPETLKEVLIPPPIFSSKKPETKENRPPQIEASSDKPIQPIVYRYSLPNQATPQAAFAFQKQVDAIRAENPDWVVTHDRPKPGEADAIILIYRDQQYATTHATYLAHRTLDQVVAPALNRIFGDHPSHPNASP